MYDWHSFCLLGFTLPVSSVVFGVDPLLYLFTCYDNNNSILDKGEREIFFTTLREILLKASKYENVLSFFQVCLTIWQHLQLLSESHHPPNFEGIALSSSCEWCCRAVQGHCVSWCFFMLSDFFLLWKPLDLFSFLFEIAFWCDLGHLSFIILRT